MNLKKGIALALTAAALLAFTGCGSNGTTSNGEYKVGVVQLVEHPALDAANKGFVDALKEKAWQIRLPLTNKMHKLINLI
ncbi:MAG: hypothetical protein ACLUPK_04030 [Veillonella sp.]